MFDYKHLPQSAGIYRILCTSNSKSYIGQATNLYVRLRDHLKHLKNNTHANPILQASFSSYGKNNFFIEVLEEIGIENISQLTDRECFWINTLKTLKHQGGFNICYPETNLAQVNAKNFIIFDPQGKKYEVFNLSEFCREHFENPQSAHGVLLGVANGRNYTYKEWQCYYLGQEPENWIPLKDFEGPRVIKNRSSLNQTKVVLYNRKNNLFLYDKILEEFVKENKYDYNKSLKCLSKKTKLNKKYTLNGWYIYSIEEFISEENVRNSFKLVFTNLNNQVFEIEEENLEFFCQEHDLDKSAIIRILSPNLKKYITHKNWTVHYKNQKPKTKTENQYKLTTPEGVELVFNSINKAAKQFSLSSKTLNKVVLGQRAHHKGYKMVKLS